MPKKSDAKQNMITAARVLMRARGVSGMGLMDVVTAAEAPRGSIYHHFPGGKDELVIAAIDEAAREAEAAILGAGEKGGPPIEVVRHIASAFRFAAEKAKWQIGCPVAATAIEGHLQTPAVRAAVSATFSLWSAAIAHTLVTAGVRDKDAQRLGLGIMSALEGALLLARGMQSAAPYDATVELIMAGLEKAVYTPLRK